MIIPSRMLGASQQPGTGLRVSPSTSLRSYVGRRRELMVLARGRPGWDKNLRKGNFHKKRRRKGRPEWMRSPDDTPLRDGTRDRTIGLLTQRAVRTLAYYLSETNPNVYHWLVVFEKENPIPRDGAWDDVSGETFLRTLLSMPIEHASWGRGTMYACNAGCGVDPRSIAQRIMEIRSRIAKEMTQDLSSITEENSELIRETLQSSFTLSSDNVAPRPVMDTPAPPPSPDTAAPPGKEKPVNRIPRVTYRRPPPPRNTAPRPPPPPDEAVEAFRAKLLEGIATQPEAGAEGTGPPPMDSVVSPTPDAAEKSLESVKDSLSRALEKTGDAVPTPEERAEGVAEKEKGVLGKEEVEKGENAAPQPEARVQDVASPPSEKVEEVPSVPEEVGKVENVSAAPGAEVEDVTLPSPEKAEEIVSVPVEEVKAEDVEAEKVEVENKATSPEAGLVDVASPPLDKAEDVPPTPVEKPEDAVSPTTEKGGDITPLSEAKVGTVAPLPAAKTDDAASPPLAEAEDVAPPPVAKADEAVSPTPKETDAGSESPKDEAGDSASPPVENVEKVDEVFPPGEGKADKA